MTAINALETARFQPGHRLAPSPPRLRPSPGEPLFPWVPRLVCARCPSPAPGRTSVGGPGVAPGTAPWPSAAHLSVLAWAVPGHWPWLQPRLPRCCSSRCFPDSELILGGGCFLSPSSVPWLTRSSVLAERFCIWFCQAPGFSVVLPETTACEFLACGSQTTCGAPAAPGSLRWALGGCRAPWEKARPPPALQQRTAPHAGNTGVWGRRAAIGNSHGGFSFPPKPWTTLQLLFLT